MKVYLIGFMGCGKSTLGQKVAKILGIDFIDTDKIITKESNLSIKSIFEELGEAAFRSLEADIINKIGEKVYTKDVIISTGGGLPCEENNIKVIKNTGLSIYLKLNTDILERRLKYGKDKRPIISLTTDENLNYTINDLLQKRSYYYEKADEIIICNQMSDKEIIDKIISLIENYKSNNTNKI
ncbi:MAG: hypothetical protein A2X12_04560 [Bacteroidetes bacterium GWE2_29_8]|nr:MAG: hypothetical protein A2X12_04560 [Bacteroidetes bacterium GWE2_29_8]OFY14446.1 MAG: hypothetical protein A2X02_01450 [Bacteroidetes bacterium GWF2_29_10]